MININASCNVFFAKEIYEDDNNDTNANVDTDIAGSVGDARKH